MRLPNDPKIDLAPAAGVLGVVGSLAYGIQDVQTGMASKTICYGKDAVLDEIVEGSMVPFAVTPATTSGVYGDMTIITSGGSVPGDYFSVDTVVIGSSSGYTSSICELSLYYGNGTPNTFLTSFYHRLPGDSSPAFLKSQNLVSCPKIPTSCALGIKAKENNEYGDLLNFFVVVRTYDG